MSDFSFDRFSLPHEIPDQVRPTLSPDDLIRDRGAGEDGFVHCAAPRGGAGHSALSPGLPATLVATSRDARSPHSGSACSDAPDGAPGDGARHLSHPAGRGWIGVGRDIGLPGESAGEGEWRFAAGLSWDGGVAGNSGSSILRQAQDGRSFGEAVGCAPGSAPASAVAPAGAGRGYVAAGLPFTPARQALFCDLLAGSGNVRAVCALIGVSAHTAYRARRRDGLFAAAWDAACVLARDHAEAVLAARALEGVEEPVFYHGEEVAQRRRYDSRLLLAHLGRLDARCSAAAEVAAGQFDALLAQLGAGAAEPLPARRDWAEAQALAAGLDARRAQAARGWAADDRSECGDEDGEDAADPVELARDHARADASAEWDARHAAACAWVDGNRDALNGCAGADAAALDEAVLDEVGLDEAGGGAAVPADLPYEVKGRIFGAGGVARLFPLDPVTLCKPACWTASTGISWALTGRASEQANALSHAYRTGRWV